MRLSPGFSVSTGYLWSMSLRVMGNVPVNEARSTLIVPASALGDQG
jgi:hypothetical protein